MRLLVQEPIFLRDFLWVESLNIISVHPAKYFVKNVILDPSIIKIAPSLLDIERRFQGAFLLDTFRSKVDVTDHGGMIDRPVVVPLEIEIEIKGTFGGPSPGKGPGRLDPHNDQRGENYRKQKPVYLSA